MAHASHTPHPRRYVSSACAVNELMPDGALGGGEVPTDGPGTVWRWLDPDAASPSSDEADTRIGRSGRFIGAPLIRGEAKLGSVGVLVVGAQADFDPTTVRPLSRDGYARPS